MIKLNRIFTILVVIVFSITLLACQPKFEVKTSHTPLQIGDTTIDVLIHDSQSPGLTYLNLHDDENTSVKAALDLIKVHGGRVIELKHSGKRRIIFGLENNKYEFDPNRMFTDIGRRSTLTRFSSVDEEALNAIETFADEVITLLSPSELAAVVTLHNTSSGGYGILSYTSEGDLANEAELVFVSDKMDPKDFFFVTDRGLYDQLSQLGINVVLQDNIHATDDGSLSVWCAQRDITYANSEALKGHRRIQKDMLMSLSKIINNNQ